MAKSLLGGAFGWLRGSIGSVTFTTSTSALDGKRRQVARQKVTKIKNPNTTAQILQRMKLGPAQRFYEAFEQAVSKGIMSHSFEGVEYGAKSRSRFLQLALAGDPKVYVPKGIDYFVPGEYQVSEGSLPSLAVTEAGFVGEMARFEFDNGNALDDFANTFAATAGLQIGDQITVLMVIENRGRYTARVARVILKAGAEVEGEGAEVFLGADGAVHFHEGYAAGAVIVSRGTGTDALRSTSVMQLFGDYKNLLSAEALEAAIASYQDNVEYNSFGSDWYLNQGTSQAFNGRVFEVTQIVSSGNEELDAEFAVGGKLVNGNVQYVMLTSDGTASGKVYVVNNGTLEEAVIPASEEGAPTPVTGTMLRAAMIGDGRVVAEDYVKMTEAIAAQAGWTLPSTNA